MASPVLQTGNLWPHRAAQLLVCATFPLIWVGGLVTTYDAGMAVPDWPSTYGYNLFLYPWQTWIGGPWDLFVEHGHRLLGALVGMLTILLVVTTQRCESRRWVKGLAWGALLLVLLQGALGGARVLLDARLIAMIHGCVGPAFFAYCVVVAGVTSPAWRRLPDVALPAGFPRLALIVTILAYLQLILGAQLRHVSPLGTQEVFRATLWLHLFLAVLLIGHALALGLSAFRAGAPSSLRRPAVALCLLVGLQIGLGAATWVLKYGWPDWLQQVPWAVGWVIEAESLRQVMTVTAHVATGSLILATSAMLTGRAWRCVGGAKVAATWNLGGAA